MLCALRHKGEHRFKTRTSADQSRTESMLGPRPPPFHTASCEALVSEEFVLPRRKFPRTRRI